MAENQTKETNNSVKAFINKVTDETKRKDSFTLIELMEKESGFPAKLWGPAIVGFGSYHYKYESGREGDAPMAGFSPRVQSISIYLATNFEGREELLKQFGKHKVSKACIYVKKLEDIDMAVLRKMVKLSVKYMKKKYG